jgi:hypothetical protein
MHHLVEQAQRQRPAPQRRQAVGSPLDQAPLRLRLIQAEGAALQGRMQLVEGQGPDGLGSREQHA